MNGETGGVADPEGPVTPVEPAGLVLPVEPVLLEAPQPSINVNLHLCTLSQNPCRLASPLANGHAQHHSKQ